jgi:energy-coupling factor transporter ATP-binding protein EcfA2
MRPNPYAWQLDHPRRPVNRGALVTDVLEHLRRGAAVKVIGGRGMGKSVLLQQLESHLAREEGTRAVLVDGPPEEATVAGAVRDLAVRLGVHDLSAPRLDDLLERTLKDDVMRLVVLFDEADQYVSVGSAQNEHAAFARSWFNKLEVTRKRYDALFNVVFAGGLGLLYLEREIGSGIVSRAEPCVLEPLNVTEIEELALFFAEDERPLDETCREALRMLSGGSPALVTYGLEQLWNAQAPSAQALEQIFGIFRERHDSFIRAVRDSVSQRGRLDAPWRVLQVIRSNAGPVPMQQLRDACVSQPNEQVTIDPEQALKLLRAAGLIKVDGSTLADPVVVSPVASILNLPETPSGSGTPVERLIQDVSSVLANLHRFGRDFHDKEGLLDEEVFSSIIAVGLRLLGWLEADREAVQVAGFTDIKVRLTRPNLGGHVIIEAKKWRSDDRNKTIQDQIDNYRVSDTSHGIAITLGERKVTGWPEAYEQTCLAGRAYTRLETPRDLVGRWQVRSSDLDGGSG